MAVQKMGASGVWLGAYTRRDGNEVPTVNIFTGSQRITQLLPAQAHTILEHLPAFLEALVHLECKSRAPDERVGQWYKLVPVDEVPSGEGFVDPTSDDDEESLDTEPDDSFDDGDEDSDVHDTKKRKPKAKPKSKSKGSRKK